MPTDEPIDQEARKATAARPCPICGKPSTTTMHPFCSKRCADVDLHRWLGGVYAIPVNAPDEDDGESPEAHDD